MIKFKINSEADTIDAVKAISEIADVVLAQNDEFQEKEELTTAEQDEVLMMVADLVAEPEEQIAITEEEVEEIIPEEEVESSLRITTMKSGKSLKKIKSSYQEEDTVSLVLVTAPDVVESLMDVIEEAVDYGEEPTDESVIEDVIVTDTEDVKSPEVEQAEYGVTLSSLKKLASGLERKYLTIASALLPKASGRVKLLSALAFKKAFASKFDSAKKLASGLSAKQFKKRIVSEFIETTEDLTGGVNVEPEKLPEPETDNINSPELEVNTLVPEENIYSIDDTTNDDIPTEFNFTSEDVEVVEIPIPGMDDTQVIELQVINSRVSVIKSAYLNPGVGHRSGYYVGDKARRILSNKKLISCKTPHLDGKVINITSLDTGCIFSNSSILGLIAVKAPILKGIKNARYSLFSRSSGVLVDKKGNSIKSNLNLVISSVASNRSTTKVSITSDYFGKIESSYVEFLKGMSQKSRKIINNLRKEVNSRGDLCLKLVDQLNTKQAEFTKKLQASLVDIENIRSASYKAEQDRVFRSNIQAVESNFKYAAEQNKKNQDFLNKIGM